MNDTYLVIKAALQKEPLAAPCYLRNILNKALTRIRDKSYTCIGYDFHGKGLNVRIMEKPHVHDFYNETTFDFGHSHRMYGTTGYDIPSGSSHVHSYNGVTTVDHAHVHYFSGTTGPAIPLPGGGHTHQYQGTTSFEHGHTHNYNSLTGNEKYSRLF